MLAAAFGWLSAPDAGAQDLARGREFFKLCAACHGPDGEGNKVYDAAVIAGLDPWYVEKQLQNFRHGVRGYLPDDTAGLKMRPMARSLVADDDVKAVAAYVGTLRSPRPRATLPGDPGRGRAAYATCAACHGEKGAGNRGIGAPPLAHQADWYLASQLNKFRQGLRGAHPQDVGGAQMRPMALTLGDPQAILDVVAYIRTLGARP